MGAPALAAWQAGGSVADALNALPPGPADGAAPVHFVAQQCLPEGCAYEQFIAEQRQVPTRDNPHDFFNGLIWHAFPRTKTRMNVLQAAEIARDGVQAQRGPVRDAITVLDENGALLSAPEPLWAALAERRWTDAFGALRPLWANTHLWLLGHAALDGELTVKRLLHREGRVLLAPENPRFEPIDITESESVHLWGVVTYVVHKL